MIQSYLRIDITWSLSRISSSTRPQGLTSVENPDGKLIDSLQGSMPGLKGSRDGGLYGMSWRGRYGKPPYHTLSDIRIVGGRSYDLSLGPYEGA
jgi:hypothetical protein